MSDTNVTIRLNTTEEELKKMTFLNESHELKKHKYK